MRKIITLLIMVCCIAFYSGLSAGNKLTATTSTFVDVFTNQTADGDTILLDAGSYSNAVALPTGKSIVIKANPTATTRPELTFQLGEPTGSGGSLSFIGLSINRSADYFYSTSTTFNIGTLKFSNCNISNINKSLINTSASGGSMSSLIIDNCIISSSGTSSTNFITMYYALGSFTLSNTTINNFKGGNFFNTKQATAGSTINVNYSNNTIYKSIANNGWALCSIEGGGYTAGNYTFNNNIIDGAAASVQPRIIYTKSGGTVVENNNLIVGWQSDYVQGTNTSTRNNLTLGSGVLASVTSIPYNSATTGDFSIPETSPIATAGVNGVCIGDPRWIVWVSTPSTISTVVSPASAGISTPTTLTINKGSKVSVSTTANFGYHFVNWTDNTGTIVSTSPNFDYTINDANVTLTANYSAVQTYSLDCSVSGGATDYMVSISPAGTLVNGKRMYEAGTKVTLTAGNNPILNFSNWSGGETSASLNITMNQNYSTNAVYSAVDYIVGWDFYKSGGQSRVADFYTKDENSVSNLILRKEDGTQNSWLDKSIVAAAGYYDKGAAVKWKNLTDKYYYQISFDASAFRNISVKSSMLLNYNGYSKQIVQYSTDNTNFYPLDTIELTQYRVWYDNSVNLPTSVNNTSKIYVRWIPDYTSALIGSASDLDGAAIAGIYVVGDNIPPPDPNAPVLVSNVPAASATNASTTGNIVLNFDEKVQITAETVTATLNGKNLKPTVSGKTITFPYTGLQYNTQYTFTLPANSVADLSNNLYSSAIQVSFTTMNRPVVTKKVFDFVVGVDGDFKKALETASAAAASGNRFHIFFPNGQYNIGAQTGDANQMTTITLPNISYVGQNSDSVVLYNKNTSEGMNVTPTINFSSTANNLYLQDLSIKNGDYRSGQSSLGRCVALFDNGTKNIFKNVNVLSNQDTYFSGSGRKYFEGGSIHGTVDYIFGGGDIFFNGCLLYMEGNGYVSAPNTTTSTTWGYVFSNCTIDGIASTNGNYHLGRPWQNAPKSVFINTTMKVLPVAEGWSDWYTAPALFAEYNSITSTGTPVDLTMRRSLYQSTIVVNPVLTATQAATYTVDNVLAGTDAWQPRVFTDPATIPSISGNGKTITWANNNYVLCWAVFRNNQFVTFTTATTYTIPSSVISGTYTVRAANEMGGLSDNSNDYKYSEITTDINPVNESRKIVSTTYYTADGRQVYSLPAYTGTIIIKTNYDDGSTKTSKMIKLNK